MGPTFIDENSLMHGRIAAPFGRRGRQRARCRGWRAGPCGWCVSPAAIEPSPRTTGPGGETKRAAAQHHRPELALDGGAGGGRGVVAARGGGGPRGAAAAAEQPAAHRDGDHRRHGLRRHPGPQPRLVHDRAVRRAGAQRHHAHAPSHLPLVLPHAALLHDGALPRAHHRLAGAHLLELLAAPVRLPPRQAQAGGLRAHHHHHHHKSPRLVTWAPAHRRRTSSARATSARSRWTTCRSTADSIPTSATSAGPRTTTGARMAIPSSPRLLADACFLGRGGGPAPGQHQCSGTGAHNSTVCHWDMWHDHLPGTDVVDQIWCE